MIDIQAYDGQWVAFNAKGNRIVASANSIAELSTCLTAAGEDLQNVVLEK